MESSLKVGPKKIYSGDHSHESKNWISSKTLPSNMNINSQNMSDSHGRIDLVKIRITECARPMVEQVQPHRTPTPQTTFLHLWWFLGPHKFHLKEPNPGHRSLDKDMATFSLISRPGHLSLWSLSSKPGPCNYEQIKWDYFKHPKPGPKWATNAWPDLADWQTRLNQAALEIIIPQKLNA